MDVTGNGRQLAQDMLWQDLMRSGVREEISDTPFPWFSTNEPLKMAAATMGVQEPVAPLRPMADPLKVSSAILPLGKPLDGEISSKPGRVVPGRIEGTIWQAGEGGGVAVVLRAHPDRHGNVPLQGPALKLLETLLERVGLAGRPVGYAVLGEAGETIQPTKREALQAAVMALAPTHVLVMGQSVVGTLVGQGIGVEGWQAAPRQLVNGFEGRVGVTYPLELLLQRPLFKRLAWQHLQRWMET